MVFTFVNVHLTLWKYYEHICLSLKKISGKCHFKYESNNNWLDFYISQGSLHAISTILK